MELATENRDLVWDLDAFNQRQRAIDFVMGFENKLCVYSDSVEQLYTNYNIFFPKEEDRRLVILPNPYAHHDIFHGLPEAAISATGLNIIAGDMVGKDEDADALLAPALKLANYRVVVKRPRKSPFLNQQKPSFSQEGKANRFDIYVNKSMK